MQGQAYVLPTVHHYEILQSNDKAENCPLDTFPVGNEIRIKGVLARDLTLQYPSELFRLGRQSAVVLTHDGESPEEEIHILTLPGMNTRGFFLHPEGLPLAISVEQ